MNPIECRDGCTIRLRRTLGIALTGLLLFTACTDPGCGGCIAPLEEPFPDEHRVYDGVQLRITQTGFEFVEQNLAGILGMLLQDGLIFEIPPSDFSFLNIDGQICETPCSLQVEIQDADVTLVSPDSVEVTGHINLEGTISLDASVLGHCEFPLQLSEKPLSAMVVLLIDPHTHYLHFDVTELEVSITNDDYDIVCGPLWDPLLEWIKGLLTFAMNTQLKSQIELAIDDLIAAETCVTCDTYTLGCPGDSACSGQYCVSDDTCVGKPLGLEGVLDLGEQLSSVDPSMQATVDMLLGLGQALPPQDRSFIAAGGLDVRVIGGAYSDKDACTPVENPAEIPPAGHAPPILFPAEVPGLGESYMAGVAIADMYLDYFIYQLWRSGMLCLSIDSRVVELVTSQSLALFLPSLNLVTDQANAPVRIVLRPQGLPGIEVGTGSFLPDGSMDEPLLYLFLPRLGIEFWVSIQGRWVLFLSLVQDVEIDIGLEFTPENQVVPILDDDSVVVTNVQASSYQLLAEDPDQLEELVPQLIGLLMPMLTDAIGQIEIPDLQGFVLDVKAVKGDVPREGTPYHDFLSIYADLDFSPASPGVETRVALGPASPFGLELHNLTDGHEIQYRLDGGPWSPFKTGPVVYLNRSLLPGPHELEVRARRAGQYRTLDPTPLCLSLETKPPPEPMVQGAIGCASIPKGKTSALGFVLLLLICLLVRTRCGSRGPGRS